MEGTPLRTPEEELAYLRAQVQQKEQELAQSAHENGASFNEAPFERFERAADTVLTEHRVTTPEVTLAENYRIPDEEANNKALGLDPDSNAIVFRKR